MVLPSLRRPWLSRIQWATVGQPRPRGSAIVVEPAVSRRVESLLEPGTASFRRATLALAAAGFATFALMHCVQPLLPEFARHFGITAAGSSLAVSLTTIALAASLPVLGALSELWGRKAIMVASLLAAGLLTLAMALMTGWPGLLVLRTLEGVTFAGLPALAIAYLGEEFHPRVVGRVVGFYVAGTAFGGMTGRLAAAALTDLRSWQFAMVVIGSFGVLAGGLVWARLPASVHFRPRTPAAGPLAAAYAAHLRDPVLRRIFVEALLLMGSFVALYNYVTFHLMEPPYSLSQASVGFVFVVFLVGMLGSAWSGSTMDRMGRRRMLVLDVGLMLAGVFVTTLSWLPAVVIGMALATFGFFGAHSVASGWVATHARRARAQASALYMVFYYVGSSVAGTSGGFFWGAWGWTGVVGFIAVLLAAALGLAYGLPPAMVAADGSRSRAVAEGI